MFLLLPFSPISCQSVSSSSFLLPGGTFSEGSPGLVAAPERTTNPRQETMVDEHSGYTAMDTRHGLDVEWLGQVAGTGALETLSYRSLFGQKPPLLAKHGKTKCNTRKKVLYREKQEVGSIFGFGEVLRGEWTPNRR